MRGSLTGQDAGTQTSARHSLGRGGCLLTAAEQVGTSAVDPLAAPRYSTG